MSDVVLAATERTERGSAAVRRLRRTGQLPGVLYGLDSEPVPVSVDAREFGHIIAGGVNTIIALQVGKTKHVTLARQVQRHTVRGDMTHVDFVKVNVDVEVAAEVPIVLTGESIGVRDGGIVDQLMFSLTISAKPHAIPEHIEHDISELAMGKHVSIGDLVLPAGVTASGDSNEYVAMVIVPRGVKSAEETAADEAAEAAASGAAAPTED